MHKKIQIGEIVERSKKLEAMLKNLDAEGRGMHELISSVQNKFDAELNKKLRFIATIRNNAIHDTEFNINDNIERFHSACDEAEIELKKIIKPVSTKRTARKKKSRKNHSPSEFNYLFLLPFIPGLNIIYFFFLLILSIFCGLKHIIMIILYLLSFAETTRGIINCNKLQTFIGAGIFLILYVCSIFIQSHRFPKLHYMPFLNIAILMADIKIKIYWKLFVITSLFIILCIASGISIFVLNYFLTGIILFVTAYIGGIIFFIYAGRKKTF